MCYKSKGNFASGFYNRLISTRTGNKQRHKYPVPFMTEEETATGVDFWIYNLSPKYPSFNCVEYLARNLWYFRDLRGFRGFMGIFEIWIWSFFILAPKIPMFPPLCCNKFTSSIASCIIKESWVIFACYPDTPKNSCYRESECHSLSRYWCWMYWKVYKHHTAMYIIHYFIII